MIAPGDQQPERGCKFAEHLTAGSAGPAVISGGAYHGKTDKICLLYTSDAADE